MAYASLFTLLLFIALYVAEKKENHKLIVKKIMVFSRRRRRGEYGVEFICYASCRVYLAAELDLSRFRGRRIDSSCIVFLICI